MQPEIVVTGIGVVSAYGAGRELFWQGLLTGRNAIRPIEPSLFDVTGYRTRIAAWIDEAELDLSFLSQRERRTSSRAERFGLIAAREAVADSGVDLERIPPERRAIVLGAGASGLIEAERWCREAVVAERLGNPDDIISDGPEMIANRVGSHFGVGGYRSTVVTACSSSAVSVGQAADLLRHGLADVVITGGSDSLARLTYGGFNSLRSVSAEPCRPFDRRRDGLSLGEGAGILVLERRRDAERRGAPIYCRMAGYGVTSDAHHMTAPDPSGEGAARALADALANARLDPSDVDYVNAHGTATPQNDRAEAAGIHRVFGDAGARLPTSSIKSMIGHCLNSAGGVEAAATCLAVARGVLPPTVGWSEPDPECRLDVVPNEAREQRVRVALSSSFAFGGNSACLVLAATR